MKTHLPFNILLAITMIAGGMAVSYNLFFRQTFAVTVGYTLPQPATQLEPQQNSLGQPDETPQESYLYDDYFLEPIVIEFPLELNKATAAELMYIPRVGDITAQRIVQYREELGGYTSLEQLMEIQGIGQQTFETISPYLYLEGQWLPDEDME